MKTKSPRSQKPKAATARSRKPAAESPVVEPLATEPPAAISKERANCEKSLKAFVTHAWPILEPVAPLQWNWHLDLICEYLTVIRNNNFRAALGAEVEGVIF